MLAQISEEDHRSAQYRVRGQSLAERDPLLPFYILTGFIGAGCVIMFSVLLPLQLDAMIDWRWTDLFAPVHILLIGLPLLAGLIVAIASFAHARGSDLGGSGGLAATLAPYQDYPISKRKFWLEVLVYLLPAAVFTVMLSEALDDSMNATMAQLATPLLVGFTVATIFHAALREWKKAIFDVLVLAQVACVVGRIGVEDSPIADNTWFSILIPTWLLDLLGPAVLVRYLLRSNHSGLRKAVTAAIILSFLVPVYVFQVLLAHRLDRLNRMNWINIFTPIYVAESILLAPFMLLCIYLALRFFCACLLGPKETGTGGTATTGGGGGGAADPLEKQTLIGDDRTR
jgi:hypothetical protein